MTQYLWKLVFKRTLISLSLMMIIVGTSWSMQVGSSQEGSSQQKETKIGPSPSLDHALTIYNNSNEKGDISSEKVLLAKVLQMILLPATVIDLETQKQVEEKLAEFPGGVWKYDPQNNQFNGPDGQHIPLNEVGNFVSDIQLPQRFDYIGEKSEEIKELVMPIEKIKELLVDKISQCITEEQQHPDRIVMYHSASTWNAFWLEIVTKLLSECQDCRIFRSSQELDKAPNIDFFMFQIFRGLEAALKPDPESCNEKCQRRRVELANYLREEGLENDQESEEFKSTVLSLSPTIFGGYSKPNESALGFWINGFAPYKSRLEDSHLKELRNIPTAFLNILNVDPQYHEEIIQLIAESYKKLFPLPDGEGKQEVRTGGVLYQFLINSKIVQQFSYVSAPFGFKIAKRISGDLTDNPLAILSAIKTNISGYIKENHDTKYMDPYRLTPLCPNGDGLDLSCTQIRFLPKKELMEDPTMVKVNRYFLDNPSDEWLEKFSKEVLTIVHAIQSAKQKSKHYKAPELTWHQTMAKIVQPYFTKPYTDKQFFNSPAESDNRYVTEVSVGGKKYKVYRPNHGLAHSLRKGFLASDIISVLGAIANSNQASTFFDSEEAYSLMNWIYQQLESDDKFIEKIEISAAFQRSGRQSEISGREGDEQSKKYVEYRNEDAYIFKKNAKKGYLWEHIFKRNADEVEKYKNALLGNFPTDDEYYIEKILYTTHLLDIRRQGDDPDSYANNLFGKENTEGDGEQKVAYFLWQRIGDYLDATGDTDEDPDVARKVRDDIFYVLANDPNGLVDALEQVRIRDAERQESEGENVFDDDEGENVLDDDEGENVFDDDEGENVFDDDEGENVLDDDEGENVLDEGENVLDDDEDEITYGELMAQESQQQIQEEGETKGDK